MGTPAILLVLSCSGSHANSEDRVDPYQLVPSPVLTLLADVLFRRTLKTSYYTYLRFVVAVFLSLLLLNLCIQGMQSRDSCVQREQAPALRYCIQEP